MNKEDSYLNRSMQIDRYINDEMLKEEQIRFELLLKEDVQLAEAVDFARKVKLAAMYQDDINIARFLTTWDDDIPLHKEPKGLDEMNALAIQIQREMMASEILQFKN